MLIVKGQFRAVNVRCEGDRVVVIENGAAVFDLPWDAALALARAIHVKAKEAEEEAKALSIIADQALLTRLGAPIGLTSRPDMLREAAKEAAWNSDLRRYVPPARAGGIASQSIVGRPTIIKQEQENDDG